MFVDQVEYKPHSCGKCRDGEKVGEIPALPLAESLLLPVPRSMRQHTSLLASLVRSSKPPLQVAEKARERVSNAQKEKIK